MPGVLVMSSMIYSNEPTQLKRFNKKKKLIFIYLIGFMAMIICLNTLPLPSEALKREQ